MTLTECVGWDLIRIAVFTARTLGKVMPPEVGLSDRSYYGCIYRPICQCCGAFASRAETSA